MARPEQGDTPLGGQGDAAPPVNSDPIAIGLQQLFATVADEPVPAEFLDLLDRIDAKEDDRQKPAVQKPSAQKPSAQKAAPTPVVSAARGLGK